MTVLQGQFYEETDVNKASCFNLFIIVALSKSTNGAALRSMHGVVEGIVDSIGLVRDPLPLCPGVQEDAEGVGGGGGAAVARGVVEVLTAFSVLGAQRFVSIFSNIFRAFKLFVCVRIWCVLNHLVRNSVA